ncbi:MAG: bifunctional glutamate N-acetyltransferase/amino-acid acetyltransferase ArgJ [Roseinatronobacter sp.]
MARKKQLKQKIKALKSRLRLARRADVSADDAETAKAKVPGASPLAPASFPDLPVIRGARFATAAAAIRYPGRTDVMLVKLAPGTAIAGTFTTSATRAASVLDAQAKIAGDASPGAAILVNSGNANAFTGAVGVACVDAICTEVAQRLHLPATRVFTSSTGVIGERLPHERILAVLDDLIEGLSETALPDAARAIMTTDTFPKGASASVALGDTTVQIAGIAKGSGMIAPDMATMLVYIFTDANIAPPVLQQIVTAGTRGTFNCITVDSDTSTSDMLLVAATGQAGGPRITDAASPEAAAFSAALTDVMRDLAHQVVRDGEGATKFVEVAVTGARSDADARKIALSIANSPLVKTAIAGEDPNWGRIVMAVGKSGAEAERDLLSIRFGPHLVAVNGQVAPSYAEDIGASYMKNSDLVIGVDLRLGAGVATIWTCDLTQRYIEINADYRS